MLPSVSQMLNRQNIESESPRSQRKPVTPVPSLSCLHLHLPGTGLIPSLFLSFSTSFPGDGVDQDGHAGAALWICWEENTGEDQGR